MMKLKKKVDLRIENGRYYVKMVDFPPVPSYKAQQIALITCWRVSFIKVDTFHLLVTLNDEAGLISERAIRKLRLVLYTHL